MYKYNKPSCFPLILILTIIAALVIYLFQNKTTLDKNLDKKAIETIVKDTISNSPELILASLEKHQIKKHQEQEQKSKDLIKDKKIEFEKSNSPSNNITDPDLTIIEFFDYNCGYCKRASHALIQAIGDDKSIKIIYKEYPILNETSFAAAKTALAINAIEPAKYVEFHNKLMNEKVITQEIINQIVSELKIDKESLEKAKLSDSINIELINNKKLAAELDIQGTPAFIIGDELVPGALDVQGFKDKIKFIKENKKL